VRRLRDILAPVRTTPPPDRGYRRLLRWAALPLTNRRWAAPMSAVAIGFGLFAGVAIGPGAAGTLATGPSLIEIPGLLGGDDGGEEEEEFAESAGEESFPEEEGFEEFGFEEFGSELEEEEPLEELPEEEIPKEEEAEVLSGIVVHANPAAGSYTLAAPTGALSTVHASKLPLPGTALSVPVRTLANGTLGEQGTRKRSGGKKRAKLEGIVTFVDPDPAAPAYAVSKRGVSVLVHVHPDPAGAAPQLPALGAFATLSVDIEALRPASSSALLRGEADETAEAPPGPALSEAEVPPPQEPPPAEPPPAPAPIVPPPPPPVAQAPCAEAPAQPPHTPAPVAVLWQRSIDAGGVPFTYSDFAGVVMAVCKAEGKLVLSADDLDEAGADLSFAVPAKIHTSRLKPGDSVLATADIGEDGTLKLTGLASDERGKGADDAKAAQGDLVSQLSK
jgi:hypothetical protein